MKILLKQKAENKQIELLNKKNKFSTYYDFPTSLASFVILIIFSFGVLLLNLTFDLNINFIFISTLSFIFLSSPLYFFTTYSKNIRRKENFIKKINIQILKNKNIINELRVSDNAEIFYQEIIELNSNDRLGEIEPFILNQVLKKCKTSKSRSKENNYEINNKIKLKHFLEFENENISTIDLDLTIENN